MPIRPGRPAGLPPSAGQLSIPAVARSMPASRCSRVDLPDPERPVNATRSAGPTAQLTECTATVAVLPCP